METYSGCQVSHRDSLTNYLDNKPSLMQGSAQLCRITKFKTNPNDQTVSMSDLIATAMNADYDGRSLKM